MCVRGQWLSGVKEREQANAGKSDSVWEFMCCASIHFILIELKCLWNTGCQSPLEQDNWCRRHFPHLPHKLWRLTFKSPTTDSQALKHKWSDSDWLGAHRSHIKWSVTTVSLKRRENVFISLNTSRGFDLPNEITRLHLRMFSDSWVLWQHRL